MAIVWIPSAMQTFTGGREVVEVQGRNLRQLIDRLEQDYPGMRQALLQEDKLKPDIAVAVDGQLSQLGLLQPVSDHNEVFFIPAISGG